MHYLCFETFCFSQNRDTFLEYFIHRCLTQKRVPSHKRVKNESIKVKVHNKSVYSIKTYLKSIFSMFAYYFILMPFSFLLIYNLDRVKRIWYLSPMRAAKVQASLRIRAVSPEPSLLAHTSSESRGTLRQKARSLAPLNGWACAVTICHDGMLEDTNSLDGAHFIESHLSKLR